MVNDASRFEVPEQMRELADRSVDQARQAFDNFMNMTQTAFSSLEDTSSVFKSGSNDLHKKALSYAEENVDSAFRFAQDVVKAGSMDELLKLQQDFMRKQMEVLGEQVRELGSSANKTAQDVTEAASKS